MLWALLSLAGGFCDALYYAMVKRSLGDRDRYLFAAGIYGVSATVLLLIAALRGLPPVSDHLAAYILITTAIEVSATILYFEALRHTDLSLAIPMLSLTPVFLIVTSSVILGEQTNGGGVVGILLILLGSFVLFRTHRKGVQSAFLDRGVLAMIAVAFLFSVNANMGKLLILHSDPFYGIALFCYCVAGVFFAGAWLRKRSFPRPSRDYALPVLGTAAALVLSAVAINIALTMQIVPFVISLKRSSILFSVVMGWVAFRESRALRRFSGSLIMTAGILCIALS
jgi:drug/metabolite transporter (DMT)-like permease